MIPVERRHIGMVRVGASDTDFKFKMIRIPYHPMPANVMMQASEVLLMVHDTDVVDNKVAEPE